MKLLFDKRVLLHKYFTGVENYVNNILKYLSEKTDVKIAIPKTSNKYFAHLWTHFVLPFKKGGILFCPANIAPVFVPKNKKLIVTVHDVAFLTHPKSFSKSFRWYYKLLVPINIKRADKIITVSEYSKREIIKYYPEVKSKIKVIYPGVDKKFSKLKNIKKKNQILYVGSLNERKNFRGVIKAYELLNDKNLKLIIVGNFSDNFSINDESVKVLKTAYKNKNIEFKQNIDNNELIKIYNESKLLLFPSFYEGFGLPVLEAMACGTPVITSKVSSLPEVGGDAVMYCNPYDVEDIRNKIEKVLNDEILQKQMTEKGLKRAKLFSWEISAKKHLNILEKI